MSDDDKGETNTNLFGCEDDRSLWTRIWQGAAGASLVLNLVAMILAGGGITILSGLVAIAIAPIVIYLQFQLSELDTLRTIQNELRNEVNRLSTENIKMAAENTKLGNQVDRLQANETKLAELTEEHGSDVESFMKLVKENEETLNGLKKAVKADVNQTILTALIDSDFDMSGSFSDQELQILQLRVKNIPGVIIDDAKLVERVKASDRKLSTVLEMVQELDREDTEGEEERIFQFDLEHLEKKQ